MLDAGGCAYFDDWGYVVEPFCHWWAFAQLVGGEVRVHFQRFVVDG